MVVQSRRTYNRRFLVGGVIYKEGKELTYRQASQLLETPDAVKTCPHSLHSSPTRKIKVTLIKTEHVKGMFIKIKGNHKTTSTNTSTKTTIFFYGFRQTPLTILNAKVFLRWRSSAGCEATGSSEDIESSGGPVFSLPCGIVGR